MEEHDELDSGDLDNPDISYNAITSTSCGNTMHVKLQIGTTPVTALIDSGSTHNFVDAITAKNLGLLVRFSGTYNSTSRNS